MSVKKKVISTPNLRLYVELKSYSRRCILLQRRIEKKEKESLTLRDIKKMIYRLKQVQNSFKQVETDLFRMFYRQKKPGWLVNALNIDSNISKLDSLIDQALEGEQTCLEACYNDLHLEEFESFLKRRFFKLENPYNFPRFEVKAQIKNP